MRTDPDHLAPAKQRELERVDEIVAAFPSPRYRQFECIGERAELAARSGSVAA